MTFEDRLRNVYDLCCTWSIWRNLDYRAQHNLESDWDSMGKQSREDMQDMDVNMMVMIESIETLQQRVEELEGRLNEKI